MNGIDLYSGIGGWTMGMKLSNVKNLQSYEWNKESNSTHNLNFNSNLKEVDIRKLKLTDLPSPKVVDFVVGSPPCTQFSFTNRGGGGDISDGLVDIYKFLKIVDYLKPKYWVMENVPRVKSIIDFLVNNDKKFKKFKKLISFNEIIDTSDYSVPQKRKRMICGNFPYELFLSYKSVLGNKNLGDVITSLRNNTITDINYDLTISKENLTDHNKENFLDSQEKRINKENKTFHPIYNGMSFPDSLKRPSRTITSTCTRVSRESIVIQDGKKFRRLSLREKGCIQGFPITFQFYGNTHSNKQKMIGNSIPPILTYYLFQSMLNTKKKDLILVENISNFKFEIPSELPKSTPYKKPKRNYRLDRSFKFAIPGLRFGSGIRFEFSNTSNKKDWTVKFYYGNSKNIQELKLNNYTLNFINEYFDLDRENIFNKNSNLLNLNSFKLQNSWSNMSKDYDNFKILDDIGRVSSKTIKLLKKEKIDLNILHKILPPPHNKKLDDDLETVLAGIYIGSIINTQIT